MIRILSLLSMALIVATLPLKASDVVISEFIAHTDEPYVDSVELQNTSNKSVDISGWYLLDSKAFNPRAYKIKNNTV